MNSDVDDFAALRAAWVEVSAKYEAYSLILPGDPLFVCRAADCDAYCCRTFSVSLGDREVERFELKSSLPRTKFLEIENGEPIYLPLAQPYLLARTEARCSMLGDNLGCTQYAGRPDACRMFPYQLLFIDENKHRDVLAGPLERAMSSVMKNG